MGPVSCRRIQRHLHEHDHHRVERKETAVKSRRQSEILHEEQRKRSLDLKEHDSHEENRGKEQHHSAVIEDKDIEDRLWLTGFVARLMTARWERERSSDENRCCGERRHGVTDEDPRERSLGDESRCGRTNAHAEVDRKPGQRVRGLELVRGHDVSDDDEIGRPEELAYDRPYERYGDYPGKTSHERHHEQKNSAHEERRTHDGKRTDAIGQAPRYRCGDDRSRAVRGERKPRARCAEAELAREVKDEERQDHRSRAIDQRRRGEHPHITWKSLETSPDVHRRAHCRVLLRFRHCGALYE